MGQTLDWRCFIGQGDEVVLLQNSWRNLADVTACCATNLYEGTIQPAQLRAYRWELK
jgi:hypothetical protein